MFASIRPRDFPPASTQPAAPRSASARTREVMSADTRNAVEGMSSGASRRVLALTGEVNLMRPSPVFAAASGKEATMGALFDRFRVKGWTVCGLDSLVEGGAGLFEDDIAYDEVWECAAGAEPVAGRVHVTPDTLPGGDGKQRCVYIPDVDVLLRDAPGTYAETVRAVLGDRDGMPFVIAQHTSMAPVPDLDYEQFDTLILSGSDGRRWVRKFSPVLRTELTYLATLRLNDEDDRPLIVIRGV